VFENQSCALIRSHPPPHAGCPRGDPGPLAVLTRLADFTAPELPKKETKDEKKADGK
jgi:hypothetical protein